MTLNRQDRLYLESKILKYVAQNTGYTENGTLVNTGHFVGDMMHKMWYFVRKHHVTETDVYHVLRRLEQQGFVELRMSGGRILVLSNKIKETSQAPTEVELDVATDNMRAKKLTINDIDPSLRDVLLKGAERYTKNKELAQKAEIFRNTGKLPDKKPVEPSTNPSDTKPLEDVVKEDQASLEDYLKDE